MRRWLRVVLGFVASVLLVCGVPLAAAASSGSDGGNLQDFTFESLTVDYTLTRAEDSTTRLRVVEEFVAVFPEYDQNRGLRRTIPTTYNGQPLHPRMVSVTDADGARRPAESASDDGEFTMTSRADDYLHGRQTFVFTYTLDNVVWDFPDTGWEFYWDVNGVDWQQPFGSVTARLHLDAELAAALTGRMACYQGAQGASTPCGEVGTADEDGGVVVTARSGALGPSETLSLAVGFRDGTFALFDSGYLASPFGWAQGLSGVALLGAGAFALRARLTRLRDAAGRPTIIAEYAPPPGLDALESAVLLGRTAQAIPAEVLEQAVVGSLRIVEGERRWRRAKLTAELVDPSRADADGRMLLRGLFPSGRPGETYEFGRSDARLSTAAQTILKAAAQALVERGLRARVPVRTRVVPLVLAALGAAAVIALGMFAIGYGTDALVPVLVDVGAIGMLMLVVGFVSRRPLTAAGAEARDHLKGLREFIEWAEADRIRMLQSPAGAERVRIDANDPRQKLRLYEALLPYAVVFGQEKEWSRQLAVLYSETGVAGPTWYYGSGTFDASAFSAGIGSLSSAATSSSSTSGGSSGGGGAGGGGGGGGGGGV
ncbi:DUF2207 family protein [Microbacterium sp.]|uniref:DUF2207 family protein n=1 Tax=Microbacterium sp. TaxID=51671 RepID=UPI0039E47A3D